MVFSLIRSIFIYIPVLIYNSIHAKFVTRYTYVNFVDRLKLKKNQVKSILDIGVGTGDPLHYVIEQIPQEVQYLGIDIDRNYIFHAQKKLQQYKNVEIREQNFYSMAKQNNKYDVIIFSSSFMLMPDQQKALEIAQSLLNNNGSIFFLLTLYQHKGLLQQLIGYIKPLMKYITTIDFGVITYENEFYNMLQSSNLQIVHKERCKGSYFLEKFKMYIVECEAII